MNLCGMMLCRNEAHQIGFTARVALQWCDQLVILLHACTDTSMNIVMDLAREFNPRVIVVGDDKERWDEMRHRQAMLEMARAAGATHLAIVDCDEVLSANLLRQFKRHSDLGGIGSILQLPGYNLRGSLARYHSNGIWGNRWFSTAFRDDERLGWAGDKFHQREPKYLDTAGDLKPYRPILQGQGGVMHLWGASERRLTAHHAWYKVNERLRWPNKPVQEIDRMYNLWRSPEDSAIEYPQQTDWAKPWTFSDVPASWREPYAHLMKYLDIDTEPWQIAECQRLVQEHGKERFAGLDLFGISDW